MRPWDQFFWWVELGDIPERFVVLPANWPQPKAKDAETEAQITQGNTIRVKTPCENVTVWLSPELVDFAKKITFGRDRVDIVPDDRRDARGRPHARRPPTSVLGQVQSTRRETLSSERSREMRAHSGFASSPRQIRVNGYHALRGMFRVADYCTSLLSRQPATNQPSSSLRTYTPAGPR